MYVCVCVTERERDRERMRKWREREIGLDKVDFYLIKKKMPIHPKQS